MFFKIINFNIKFINKNYQIIILGEADQAELARQQRRADELSKKKDTEKGNFKTLKTHINL